MTRDNLRSQQTFTCSLSTIEKHMKTKSMKKRAFCSNLKLQPATLLKVTFLHGCFSRFLLCTNDNKSRKAPHICGDQFYSKNATKLRFDVFVHFFAKKHIS